jgi:hypothetical protein
VSPFLGGEYCKCGHAVACHDADKNGLDSRGDACAHCDCKGVDKVLFSACGAVWFPGMDIRDKSKGGF